MSSELTKTSYAILGLLNVAPWTPYELAQQMDRSLRHFWPRAQSVVYEEPKRLAKLGYARATVGAVGRRQRTTYTITAKGRRALKHWLASPTESPPALEFEALLKIFYSEQGTRADTLDAIASMRAWAKRQAEENVAFARAYRENGAPFPARGDAIGLTGQFMVDFADMVARWAAWAEVVVTEPPPEGVLDAVTAQVLAVEPVHAVGAPAPQRNAKGKQHDTGK